MNVIDSNKLRRRTFSDGPYFPPKSRFWESIKTACTVVGACVLALMIGMVLALPFIAKLELIDAATNYLIRH